MNIKNGGGSLPIYFHIGSNASASSKAHNSGDHKLIYKKKYEGKVYIP